ncbi:MAG: hypothetical protein OXI10_00005 [Gammaproteobacteria bacterium]|nr:hypothetical protein [Gammaproteobacteria bacterium]
MHDTTDNALVEISLALAMAFFALLVVALVSINVSPTPQDIRGMNHSRTTMKELDYMAALAETRRNMELEPRFLLFHHGHWFDIKGVTVDPALLATDERRLVVALAPDLTLADAREAQKAVHHLDPVPALTTLTREWIERLDRRESSQ